MRSARWTRTLAPLAATCALLLFGLAPAASATFPGERGRIAFDRKVGPSNYVYTARASGKDQRRLPCTRRDTAGRCYDSGPTWSADGKLIALTNATGFALVRPDGSVVRQIAVTTFGGVQLYPGADGPSISPNGQRLVFFADDEDSISVGDTGSIYTVNVDGSGLDQLASEAVSPAFSATGRIAFAAGGIFIHRPTQSKDVYGGEADDPVWGPGSKRIAFSCDSFESICERRASGEGKVRRFVKVRKGDERQRTEPAYSPDGRYLIYERFTSANNIDVLVRRLKTGRTRVIQNARNPDWQPRP